ncbi:unnamed protein product [Dovyalis caffra]|uniref:Uncharacterized protein n=1 Tax=Dovyalis caffra TaxID=77055 RepID=A0AAV1QUK0_9ROSI|nr:unnamed protein product [Dovyalis caffra]
MALFVSPTDKSSSMISHSFPAEPPLFAIRILQKCWEHVGVPKLHSVEWGYVNSGDIIKPRKEVEDEGGDRCHSFELTTQEAWRRKGGTVGDLDQSHYVAIRKRNGKASACFHASVIVQKKTLDLEATISRHILHVTCYTSFQEIELYCFEREWQCYKDRKLRLSILLSTYG